MSNTRSMSYDPATVDIDRLAELPGCYTQVGEANQPGKDCRRLFQIPQQDRSGRGHRGSARVSPRARQPRRPLERREGRPRRHGHQAISRGDNVTKKTTNLAASRPC